MSIVFKEWEINKRVMVRWSITELYVGISIGPWTWINLPMISICLNFTTHPMYGEEEEYVE